MSGRPDRGRWPLNNKVASLAAVSFVIGTFSIAWGNDRPPRVLDVFVVAGQSNAVGADADPGQLPPGPDDGRVLFWWKAGDPPADVHDSSSGDAWTTLRIQDKGNPITPANNATRQWGNFKFAGGGFGPEVGLARELLTRFPDRYVDSPALAVFKVAYSGTSVEDDWNPDQIERRGNCLGELVRQFGLAKASARDANLVLRPVALVWVQGESDATESRSTAYQVRLRRTLDAIRDHLDAPTMEIRLGVNTQFKPAPPAQMAMIVGAQTAIADQDPRCRYVDTSSASIANDVHFDAPGTITVGQLMAESLFNSLPPNTIAP